mmetsp:Transcript_70386/g.158172  ORF Transcript_70386/g.158172 Transcript_70386/m.158172 type:complete len:645 (-) Transcript_70386:91-2025(-)
MVDIQQQMLSSVRDEARRLHQVAEQAVVLEHALEKARRLAEEAAAQKKEAAQRAGRRVVVLDETIDTLNASISENLTTLVSTWLAAQADDEMARESASGSGWGSRLLSAARNALVSVVGSIESFLERYVVSLSDKDSIKELVHTVEERRAAYRQKVEAEKAVIQGEAQARDAAKSLGKAEASRKSAQEAAKEALPPIADAEESLRFSQELLEQTKGNLTLAQEDLEKAKSFLAQRDTQLEDALSGVAAADDTLQERKQTLKVSLETLEIAKAEVVEATAALVTAEGARAEAEADASDAYFTQLRKKCSASDGEFAAYLEARELVMLVTAVRARRAQLHISAGVRHTEMEASLNAAKVARVAARNAVADAQSAHHDRMHEAAAADAAFALRQAERNTTATKLAAAQAALRHDREQVARLQGLRQQAVALVESAAAALHAATKALGEALKVRTARAKELRLKVDATLKSALDLQSAEAAEDDAMKAVEAAKVWLADYVASLFIAVKERALEKATDIEERAVATEAKASRRENRMKVLLDTHRRHLALLNTQVELPEKESAHAYAKGEHAKAEQALIDQDTKTKKLVEDEAKATEDIAKTYQDLQKLLKDYEDANEAYAKQDPKDRERSFATMLEGSGPDAGGVDVR